MNSISKLKTFRQVAYENLCRVHDATFELTDPVMLTPKAYCLADLSQCPVLCLRHASLTA